MPFIYFNFISSMVNVFLDCIYLKKKRATKHLVVVDVWRMMFVRNKTVIFEYGLLKGLRIVKIISYHQTEEKRGIGV